MVTMVTYYIMKITTTWLPVNQHLIKSGSTDLDLPKYSCWKDLETVLFDQANDEDNVWSLDAFLSRRKIIVKFSAILYWRRKATFIFLCPFLFF